MNLQNNIDSDQYQETKAITEVWYAICIALIKLVNWTNCISANISVFAIIYTFQKPSTNKY